MRLYLTMRPLNELNDYIKISDTSILEETKGTKFYFEVTNGKLTLPFFKKNILFIESSIFYTKNIEYFFFLFDFLRDEEFKIVEENNFINKMEIHKLEIRNYLINQFTNKDESILKSIDLKNIDKIVNRLTIGDVISYIKTSFFNPSAYLCKQTMSHKIINHLNIKNLTLNEIYLLFKGEEVEIRIHLKSLLYFGVIKKKGNKFFLVI